ncbi:MAG: mechanosensitive ion channel family protein [Firmicutes bacterium]|nr:mechanosensitive ion channel family protein [Bacillota bacterium]
MNKKKLETRPYFYVFIALSLFFAVFFSQSIYAQTHVEHTLSAKPGLNASPSASPSAAPSAVNAESAASPIPASPAAKSGYPVCVGDKELFRLYSSIGPYTAQMRAEIASEKLTEVFNDPASELNFFSYEHKQYTSVINYKTETIFTITSEDSKAVGLPVEEYSRNCYRVIQLYFADYRKSRDREMEKKGIVYALVAIFLSAGMLVLIRIIFGFAADNLHKIGIKFRGIKIGETVLLPGEQIASYLLFITAFARWISVIAVFYTCLTYIFGLFSQTRSLGLQLGDLAVKYLSDLLSGFIGYLPNLVIIIFAVLLLKAAIDFSNFIFSEIEQGKIKIKGFYPEWVEPTAKIVNFLLIALAVSIIFPYLPGYNSKAFQGVSIFLGVLFSLGSSGIVANIIAGFSLIYTRAFTVGDRVKIGDATGDIIDRTLLVTKIRTPKNVQISIPNSTVINSHVINYSEYAREKKLILHTTVTIGYDAPWQQVHKLLIDAATATKNVLLEPKPFVLQTSLNDYHVSYEINVYIDQTSLIPIIYSELHSQIQDKFNEGGVEILSPGYANLRDGNKTTIPENYLSDGYQAPGFKITGGENPYRNR